MLRFRGKTMKIQHLRLINGDEVIGAVLGENDGNITVDHPLVVCAEHTEQGSYLALKKFLPYSKENIINFQKGHVISVTDLHDDIIKYYFLSLRYSKISEDSTLKSIQSLNDSFEQMLTSQPVNLLDKLHHIVPGTNTKQ